MHVAITGSTGFIGTALVAALRADGATVTRLVRSEPGPGDARWDPAGGGLDPAALQGVDAVVHLAGEPIAARRWTAAQKRRIRDSRTEGTALLARAMAAAVGDGGPRTLVSASGIGYYGDRGDEVLAESSPPGRGFIADVVAAWEAAADPAREAGIRVVTTRTGIVLDPAGGALPRLLPLFRAGLGGRMGAGTQWWSWIALADVIGIVQHALASDEVVGAINTTAPNPVTNAELTRTLAGVLRRPALLPVPAFGPALLLGRELAQELLFSSARVLPQRTQALGYRFRHPDLEPALRAMLGRR